MRRALIAGGLSITLLAAAASSASAATISPTSLNFGSQPLNTTSAPQTFTLTKGSETTFLVAPLLVDDSLSYYSTTTCPRYLTNATPSCTMTFTFMTHQLGPDNGTLYTTEGSSTAPTATLTGTGVAAGKKCKKGKKLSAQSAKKKKCGKKKSHL